ncbi:DUF2239 family protein, partial [uncultured Brevundimonas sp.]|uniref:DUF2239 family protein n=1 Tax=uncultured Brevundimonas sp. TaxID=213418 RepID=UPI00262BC90E
FDDRTGRVVDLDLRGTQEEIAARYAPEEPAARGRGRPKLGVVPREVTLLPRHWDWLQAQPGGASAALRRLVEEARRNDAGATAAKAAQERVYRFLTAVAGDFAGYEEAVRALFASDQVAFRQHTADWPSDVVDYALALQQG